MKKPTTQYVTIPVSPEQYKNIVEPTTEQTSMAYRFFGLTPPPQQLEMDYSKLEERVLGRPTGGKTIIIDKLLEGFAAQNRIPVHILSHRAQACQFFGRATRKHPQFDQIPRKSKAQRKLDVADYELKNIKANFELEAGLAYRNFLAGVVHSPELRAVATNLPSHVGRGWYSELLADLGYSPRQLGLPTPEAK